MDSRKLLEQHVHTLTALLRGGISRGTGRRAAEDPDERERLGVELHEAEDELKAALKDVLEDLLPEAFATVKEACRRLVGTPITVTGQEMTWDMVPYDVQLIGGVALHRGKVAEMATGEGKTLVATMPVYLNALTGRGVHLVTVNTYLAQRDSSCTMLSRR